VLLPNVEELQITCYDRCFQAKTAVTESSVQSLFHLFVMSLALNSVGAAASVMHLTVRQDNGTAVFGTVPFIDLLYPVQYSVCMFTV